MCPSSQVGEVLAALIPKNPLQINFSEANWASHPLESPIVVCVRLLMCHTLELEADLAEVKGDFVKGVLQRWMLPCLIWVLMGRENELLDQSVAPLR